MVKEIFAICSFPHKLVQISFLITFTQNIKKYVLTIERMDSTKMKERREKMWKKKKLYRNKSFKRRVNDENDEEVIVLEREKSLPKQRIVELIL